MTRNKFSLLLVLLAVLCFFMAIKSDAHPLISPDCGDSLVMPQYRETQDSPFIPPLDTSRLSTPDRQVMNVRVAYTNPMTNLPIKDPYKITGLRTRGDQLVLGTDQSRLWLLGSSVTVGCEGGVLAGGTVINSLDAPDQQINYGGPHVTFGYYYKFPWPSVFSNGSNGITLSFYSHIPFYYDMGGNLGGDVAALLRFKNLRNGDQDIGLVVRAYALNSTQGFPNRIVGLDPNDGSLHVATSFKLGYVRGSGPVAYGDNRIMEADSPLFRDKFTVTIQSEDLQRIIDEWYGYGNVEDFGLLLASVHFELNDNEGDAIMAGAFSNFKVEYNDG